MSIFESIDKSTTKGVKSGEDYIKCTEAYYKLKVFQQLSLSFSLLIKLALIGVFIFLGLIFLAIAAAIALGNSIGSISLGILIVGLTLILFGFIPYALRKRIDKTILIKFSKSFFD